MRLVTVAARTTAAEAHIVRAKLESEGIHAFIADEMLSTFRWDLSNAIGGVKVQVAEEDYDRALEILHEAAEIWTCALCGETVSGGWERCWSCGASQAGEADPDFVPDEIDARPSLGENLPLAKDSPDREEGESMPYAEAPRAEGDNPFRSPRAPHEPQATPPEDVDEIDTSVGDDIALRAWRAAALGLVFCPPALQFYSAYLLLSLAFSGLPLSRRAVIRCRLAWIIDLLMAAVFGLGGWVAWR